MLINIRTMGRLMSEELLEKLAGLPYPAVLLDETLKIVEKNRESVEFASFLKKGTKIHRYIPESDIAKLIAMKPCDTLITEVSTVEKRCHVNVICGVGCRLIVFQPAVSGLFSGVSEKYMKMSGYDADIQKDGVYASEDIHIRRFSKKFSEIIESVCAAHCEILALPFFNVAAILTRLVSEIELIAPRKIKINLDLSSSELIGEGSEKDFVLVSAFMISLCLESMADGELTVLAEDQMGEMVLSVFCDSQSSAYGMAKSASMRMRQGNSSADENDFLVYMLKLLADANLWDISVSSDMGKSGFVLRIPCVKSGEEFTVRDASVEFIGSVVAEVFGLSQKGIEK